MVILGGGEVGVVDLFVAIVVIEDVSDAAAVAIAAPTPAPTPTDEDDDNGDTDEDNVVADDVAIIEFVEFEDNVVVAVVPLLLL